MSFVSGMLLIDAPASALNNAGADEGARTDNTIAVKKIRTRAGDYPYVSAQAVRFWLRTGLEHSGNGWTTAPVYREAKVAYTDANPILYADDDLFGYMRAQSKKAEARAKRAADEKRSGETETTTEITRVSPLRMSTLVSLAPVRIVDDFGTMARHDGDPVPHEHQFYRATLQGLFSIDLSAAGTFFNGGRVGYRNLDDTRVKLAQANNMQNVRVHGQPAWRLPVAQRADRLGHLVSAIGKLQGGAKLALHYTDVTPAFVIAAVLRGGNHPFARVVHADRSTGLPRFNLDAFREVLKVYSDQFQSSLYLGWPRGFMDEHRPEVEAFKPEGLEVIWGHPREAMAHLADALRNSENAAWLD